MGTLAGLLVFFLTSVFLHKNWRQMKVLERTLDGVLASLGLAESVFSLVLIF